MVSTKKMTVEQAVNMASAKLASNIQNLTAESDAAISVFKSTETKLNTVNEKLQQNVDQLAELEAVIHSRKLDAVHRIESNAAVAEKIRKIIEG